MFKILRSTNKKKKMNLDIQARTYTMQVAKQLFEYGDGKRLIISSEAEIVSELRNPADVFYL